MIKVLFFGSLSDAAQPLSCELPKDVNTVADLAFWLASNCRRGRSHSGKSKHDK